MTINIATLKAMAAAGATADAIIAAVEAQQRAAEDALAARRRADKERQRRHRERVSRESHGHNVSHVSHSDKAQAVGRAARSDTTDSMPAARAAPKPNGPQTAQKERSPTPPKEKLHLQGTPSLFFNEGEEVSEIARARGKRAGGACRLPNDWQPTPEGFSFAVALIGAERAPIELDKFRDHWRAANGPPSVKRDWDAAWRNWCRRAVEMNHGNGNGQHRQSGQSGGGGRKGRGFAAFALQRARAAGLDG